MEKNIKRKMYLIGTLFFGFFLICFMSRTVSANPGGFYYFDSFLLSWPFLVIINLPINGVMYIGFLRYMCKKDKGYIFENDPSVFTKDVIIVTVLATFFGAIVDTLFLFAILGYYSNIIILFLIPLVLIFLSFYLLIVHIQKLKPIDAIKIGVGITIINLLSWIAIIFLLTITIYTILLITIIFYIIFGIYIFKLKLWYSEKHISSREKIKEEDLSNKKREKLHNIEKQNIVSIGIIIVILLSFMFINILPQHHMRLAADLTYKPT